MALSLSMMRRPRQRRVLTAALLAPMLVLLPALLARTGALPAAAVGVPSGATPLRPLLVVLDLDETLYHSTFCPGPGPGAAPRTATEATATGAEPDALPPAVEALLSSLLPATRMYTQVPVDLTLRGPGMIVGLFEEIPLYVSFRPGAFRFVQRLLDDPGIEIAVYTAGTKQYAQQTLKRLGLSGVRALFRDECVPFGLPVTKDLTKLRSDLSRVVLVDNAARSFWLQPENGLLVSDWLGTDPTDAELSRVDAELSRLGRVTDVRDTLGKSRAGPAAASGPAAAAALGAAALAAGGVLLLLSTGAGGDWTRQLGS